jgi:hypothetical protein
MQGSFRRSRADGPGRVLYRCEIRRSRALPAELIDHPATVYVRQDAIVTKVDEWICHWRPLMSLPRASYRTRPPTGNGPPWGAG